VGSGFAGASRGENGVRKFSLSCGRDGDGMRKFSLSCGTGRGKDRGRQNHAGWGRISHPSTPSHPIAIPT